MGDADVFKRLADELEQRHYVLGTTWKESWCGPLHEAFRLLAKRFAAEDEARCDTCKVVHTDAFKRLQEEVEDYANFADTAHVSGFLKALMDYLGANELKPPATPPSETVKPRPVSAEFVDALRNAGAREELTKACDDERAAKATVPEGAPERMWIAPAKTFDPWGWAGSHGPYLTSRHADDGKVEGDVEYVRADIHDAAVKRAEEAMETAREHLESHRACVKQRDTARAEVERLRAVVADCTKANAELLRLNAEAVALANAAGHRRGVEEAAKVVEGFCVPGAGFTGLAKRIRALLGTEPTPPNPPSPKA